MTPSEQIQALARFEGYEVCAAHRGKNLCAALEFWTKDEKEFVARNCLPNYTIDLNAVHRVVKKLTPAQREAYHIYLVRENPSDSPTDATAAQRAEALIHAINLSTDVI